MSSHMTEPVTSDGAGTSKVTAAISDNYFTPVSPRSVLAQACVMLSILTGIWVAISPWFLVLQHGGNNATANNLIAGLAVTALGLFAVSGGRGFPGLEAGSVLAGVWLIISPFILNAKFVIADPTYWSNSFAGGLVTVVGLAALWETWRVCAR